nr:hypothetical protein B0A51_01021 [Rachicladosporium sp. CCFEE 5018]
MSTKDFQVAIVGAGPAGLLLAIRLLQAEISFLIFEGRTREQLLQQQGRSLDLHPSSGLAALDACGLKSAVFAHARQEGNGVTVTDKRLQSWFSYPGGSRNPHVDREDLIQLLVDAVPAANFRWNHKLQGVDTDNSLLFRDGSRSEPFCFVVGADGAWSRVRAALSPRLPEYTGIAGQTFVVTSRCALDSPILRNMPRTGSLFSFSDKKAFIVHYMSKDRASFTLFQTDYKPPDRGAEIDPVDEIKRTRRLYEDWDVQFVRLLEHVDPVSMESWQLHMMPLDFNWPVNPRCMVIGDAASLRSPFGGEGVNLALQDAFELSGILIAAAKAPANKRQQMLGQEVSKFQRTMLDRGHLAQKLAKDMQAAMMDSSTAPRGTVADWVMLRARYEFSFKSKWWRMMLLILDIGVHAYYAGVRLLH